MGKDGFVFRTSWKKQLALLSDDEKGRLLMALIEFSDAGEVPEGLSPMGDMAFSFISDQIKEDAEREEEIRRKRREGGKLGGAREGNQNARKNNLKVDLDEENNLKVDLSGDGNEKQPYGRLEEKRKGKEEEKRERTKEKREEEIPKRETEEVCMGCAGAQARENSNKNKETGQKRFVPPTIEEVKDYCQERGNRVDADRWYAYYQSNGWRVGKNPMKDWRAAVRTWERNYYDTGGGGRSSRGDEYVTFFDMYKESLEGGGF